MKLAHGDRFDVVVLDASIPGVDSASIVRSLRAAPGHASVPIVLLGTLPPRGRAVGRAWKERNTSVLVKPVKQTRLLQLVASLTSGAAGAGGRNRWRARPAQPRRARAAAHPLIAEDNRINQKVALKAARAHRLHADVAANGVEALRARARRRRRADGRADAEMDGLSARRAIRERWPGSSGRA